MASICCCGAGSSSMKPESVRGVTLSMGQYTSNAHPGAHSAPGLK